MLISSRCSLLTGQFAQWRGHGKIYCVGVQRFMFEAWQFLLAHRARLLDTVDFVLYELFRHRNKVNHFYYELFRIYGI